MREEALALEWQHIGERTILIEGAVALGNVKETKTRQTPSVRLLAPLATDVAEWRLACGRPDGSTLVFPGLEGRPWADHDWRNWRKRVYAPVADAAQPDGSRPYDLRHAFCSLLIAEGLSVVEIAQQAGHSPAMTLATYAHVIEELAGTERRPAEAVIRDARDKLVSEIVRLRHASVVTDNKDSRYAGLFLKPSDGLEPSTPSLPCDPIGNRWQPVATVMACFSRFSGLSICDRLPLVATARLHKRSILGAGIRF